MYQLMPLCDEFVVMDLGSTDGTLEILREIEAANPKLKIVYGSLYKNDAAIFADLANEVISMASYPHVLYYQADEIWHENLVELTRQALTEDKRNLSFWRYQLKYNFQQIKWFPHPVHRVGPKDNFFFTNDGMNTDKVFDSIMVSNYGLEHFTQWGDKYKDTPHHLPTNEMILDVSLTGAFLDNIPDRRRMHLPFWNEPDVMPADEGAIGIDTWHNRQRNNSAWLSNTSEFNVPEIMEYHLGKSVYKLRPKLLEDLKSWR